MGIQVLHPQQKAHNLEANHPRNDHVFPRPRLLSMAEKDGQEPEGETLLWLVDQVGFLGEVAW